MAKKYYEDVEIITRVLMGIVFFRLVHDPAPYHPEVQISDPAQIEPVTARKSSRGAVSGWNVERDVLYQYNEEIVFEGDNATGTIASPDVWVKMYAWRFDLDDMNRVREPACLRWKKSPPFLCWPGCTVSACTPAPCAKPINGRSWNGCAATSPARRSRLSASLSMTMAGWCTAISGRSGMDQPMLSWNRWILSPTWRPWSPVRA